MRDADRRGLTPFPPRVSAFLPKPRGQDAVRDGAAGIVPRCHCGTLGAAAVESVNLADTPTAARRARVNRRGAMISLHFRRNAHSWNYFAPAVLRKSSDTE